MTNQKNQTINSYQDYLNKYYPNRSALETSSAEAAKETAARMAKETLDTASKNITNRKMR